MKQTRPMRELGPWLFDLAADPDESYDVTEKHPEAAGRLRDLLEAKKAEIATNPRRPAPVEKGVAKRA